jgi:MoaA/NifB/PqqE/SkfB family radical SAM enzyme
MTSVAFPSKVLLQTISRCNAACHFCPYPYLAPRLPQDVMEDKVFRRIIDECAQHPGQVDRLMLHLMNEPLMDPSLLDRINYAKERVPDACVHILTNGSLLTERLSDDLIDSGLDWIGLSVHGLSKVAYERAMGLKHEITYGRVERFITKAISRRGPGFVMVAFNGGGPITSEEREAELEYFRRLGVVRISYFSNSISRAGNVPVLPAVRNARIQGCRSIWATEMIHILSNGDVILCCMDWSREVVLGNLQQSSIEEIWQGEAYHRARGIVAGRALLPEGFLCRRCEEAIVDPAVAVFPLAVALIALPFAERCEDAVRLTRVLDIFREYGLEERYVDLGSPDGGRPSNDDFFEMMQVRPGVEEDLSRRVVLEFPEEVERTVERCRSVEVEHLLFLLCPVNFSLTIEVVRRIKERIPERSIWIMGTTQDYPAPLERFDVPYCRCDREEEAVKWIADRLGITLPRNTRAEVSEREEVPQEPFSWEFPWRPFFEGKGRATRGLSLPAALAASTASLTRWVGGLKELPWQDLRRNPRGLGQAFKRVAEESLGLFLRWVLESHSKNGDPSTVSGVPGSLDLGEHDLVLQAPLPLASEKTMAGETLDHLDFVERVQESDEDLRPAENVPKQNSAAELSPLRGDPVCASTEPLSLLSRPLPPEHCESSMCGLNEIPEVAPIRLEPSLPDPPEEPLATDFFSGSGEDSASPFPHPAEEVSIEKGSEAQRADEAPAVVTPRKPQAFIHPLRQNSQGT